MSRWIEKSGVRGGETIPFDRCWELAKRWYAGRHEVDWQPRTPAEIDRLFAELGLTAPFWRGSD